MGYPFINIYYNNIIIYIYTVYIYIYISQTFSRGPTWISKPPFLWVCRFFFPGIARIFINNVTYLCYYVMCKVSTGKLFPNGLISGMQIMIISHIDFAVFPCVAWLTGMAHPQDVASGQHQLCPWLQWLQGVDVFFVPMMRSESWYHWIGPDWFCWENLTGNAWVFAIKLIGLSCKLSRHTILWRYHWNFSHTMGAALEKSTLLRRVVRRTASRDGGVMFCL